MKTPKSEVFFSVKPMTWGPQESTLCSHCGRQIKHLEDYFYDLTEDADYCDVCGKELRYRRKKWTERGWAPPKDLREVQAKMKQLAEERSQG